MSYRLKAWSLCVVAAALTIFAVASFSRRGQQIPDQVTCDRCEISFDTIAVLGDADGPGSLPSTSLSVSRDSQGRFFVYRVYSSELQVFSASGRFLARVSRAGSGPGEIDQIAHVLVGPGDTIHVLDNTLSRWTLFSPELQYIRSVPTSIQVQAVPALVLRTGELLVAQDLRGPTERGFPVHVLGRSGAITRSFGARSADYRPDVYDQRSRQLAIGPSGEVWAAHRSRYRVDLLDPASGTVTRSIERTERWFPPTDLSPSDDYTVGNPPRTRIFDIMIDPQGRIWTHVSTADQRWKSAVRQRDETHIEITDRTKYYDAIIEVLDPTNATVLASTRLDVSPGRFLGQDMVYVTTETDDGSVKLTVLRAVLSSR